jgi:hypothetical protein
MATFGRTAIDGTSVATGSADRVYLSSATPASNGTTTSLTVRASLSVTSTNARPVIYDSDGTAGAPGTLLAEGDVMSIGIDTQYTANIALAVTAAHVYWFGIHIEDNGTQTHTIYGFSTASETRRANDAYAGGAATPFNQSAVANGPMDCFVTYTEAGGGTTGPTIGGQLTRSRLIQGKLVR